MVSWVLGPVCLLSRSTRDVVRAIRRRRQHQSNGLGERFDLTDGPRDTRECVWVCVVRVTRLGVRLCRECRERDVVRERRVLLLREPRKGNIRQ